MSTEMLERRFAAIGARVNVSGDGRAEPRVEVRSDRRGGNAFGRRSPAYVGQGQGEWFFVRAPEVDPPVTLVLFDEPLPRGRGKAHVMQFAYRRDGRVVWVSRRYRRGLTDAQYRRLTRDERLRGDWSRMVRDPEVFAKGTIRHPDHATIVLRGWHRVAMNAEQAARAIRHLVFVD